MRMITFDKSKQANTLGINFRTKLELETTKDILEDFFQTWLVNNLTFLLEGRHKAAANE